MANSLSGQAPRGPGGSRVPLGGWGQPQPWGGLQRGGPAGVSRMSPVPSLPTWLKAPQAEGPAGNVLSPHFALCKRVFTV